MNRRGAGAWPGLRFGYLSPFSRAVPAWVPHQIPQIPWCKKAFFSVKREITIFTDTFPLREPTGIGVPWSISYHKP